MEVGESEFCLWESCPKPGLHAWGSLRALRHSDLPGLLLHPLHMGGRSHQQGLSWGSLAFAGWDAKRIIEKENGCCWGFQAKFLGRKLGKLSHWTRVQFHLPPPPLQLGSSCTAKGRHASLSAALTGPSGAPPQADPIQTSRRPRAERP